MQWGLDNYGDEVIELNNFGETVLHQLPKGDLYTNGILKIIEMCKRFLGEGFKEYVAIKNKNGYTACALARMNHADPKVIKKLNPANINRVSPKSPNNSDCRSKPSYKP